jgi:uncharacterized repeat protein (TIGR01451 family)
VGDVNADDVDEIVVLYANPTTIPAEAYVDIYDQTGALLKGFNVPYTLDLVGVAVGTSPDRDGDGLSDRVEMTLGTDPMHKDLFLEFDWVAGNEPEQAEIKRMREAFVAAPIDAGGILNPDGQPGITLWVDTGSLTDTNGIEDGAPPGSCNDGIDNGGDGDTDLNDPDCLVGDDLGGGNQVTRPIGCLDSNFYTTKKSNFDPARKLYYRYGISGDRADNDPCGGGRGEIGGNDFIEYVHNAGTIMHEFGHTLTLLHGGNENNNCKPNYISVMNYDLQMEIPQVGGATIIDYSPPRLTDQTASEDGAGAATCGDGIDNGGDGVRDADDSDCLGGRSTAPLPKLVENELTELVNLDPGDGNNRFVFVDANGAKRQGELNQNVDWNGDNADPPWEAGPLTVNINTSGTNGHPARCTNSYSGSALKGHDDWSVIALNFRPFGDVGDAPVNPTDEPHPTIFELIKIREAINTTDVAITKSDSIDPVLAGGQLVYTLLVTNKGPNPASDVLVVDYLPSEVTYQSDDAGCVEDPIGTLTCKLGEITVGESREINITVVVNSNLGGNIGSHITLTNQVAVDNLLGPDPDNSNDTASEDTLVNSPPVAMCQDVTVPTDPGVCIASVASVDNGSYDPDGDNITLVQTPPGPYPLGDTNVTLTVTDDWGASASCSATVTVEDREPPVIECNAPTTIVPPDAPISFTATATDNCNDDPSVEITGYDCYFFTKKGKRVDKTESCVVEYNGDTITILDTGGVGDNITWNVNATDDSGNTSEIPCEVVVVNPGQG